MAMDVLMAISTLVEAGDGGRSAGEQRKQNKLIWYHFGLTYGGRKEIWGGGNVNFDAKAYQGFRESEQRAELGLFKSPRERM